MCTCKSLHQTAETDQTDEDLFEGVKMDNRNPLSEREPQPRPCRRQHAPIIRPKPRHPDEQARALAIWRFDHDLIEYPSQELH